MHAYMHGFYLLVLHTLDGQAGRCYGMTFYLAELTNQKGSNFSFFEPMVYR